MSTFDKHIGLLRLLIGMAQDMLGNKKTTLSSAAIAELRDEIAAARIKPVDFPRVIDIEAMCLLEYLAELTYARSDGNASRASRMEVFSNSLLTFLQVDLATAERASA